MSCKHRKDCKFYVASVDHADIPTHLYGEPFGYWITMRRYWYMKGMNRESSYEEMLKKIADQDLHIKKLERRLSGGINHECT